ncbi:hypothetical protein F2P81_003481 [Scophthalmus maximus]|uniref:Uncharacterized protein n=1 Tax=Scophthalmus maximus TaxID=52904 RepID=A0A6A4TEC1_SCOMX|nr:hypothetical protein F2P81_003481 [Scophthalmus maximus]
MRGQLISGNNTWPLCVSHTVKLSELLAKMVTVYNLTRRNITEPLTICNTYDENLPAASCAVQRRQVTSLANVTCCSGITLLTDLSRAERSAAQRYPSLPNEPF